MAQIAHEAERAQTLELKKIVATMDDSIHAMLRQIERAKVTLAELSPATIAVSSVPPRMKEFAAEMDVRRLRSQPGATRGEVRILAVIKQCPWSSRNKIAILAGLGPKSVTYSTHLNELKAAGLVERQGQRYNLTPDGTSQAADMPPLPMGEDLRDYWRRTVGGGGLQRIFDVLVQHYPHHMRHKQLADQAGMSHTSGTLSTYISKLCTLGIVERDRGSLRASPHLFTDAV